MKSLLRQFVRGEAGQDLIEYGLLASLISVCALTVILTVGTSINSWYQTLGTQVSATP